MARKMYNARESMYKAREAELCEQSERLVKKFKEYVDTKTPANLVRLTLEVARAEELLNGRTHTRPTCKTCGHAFTDPATPNVTFRGEKLLAVSAETLLALGIPLPPNRPKGPALVECDGKRYYWKEVPE
jgi:hypothetical protein